jgi:hypothetical protein
VGLGMDIPVYGQVTLGLLTQYRNVSSNIPAFSTRDLSVTAGPTIRF